MFQSLAIFLLPVLGSYILVVTTGTSWPVATKLHVWLGLSVLPALAVQCLRARREARGRFGDSSNSPDRILHKTIALTLSWTAVLACTYIGSLLGIDASTVLLDDVLPILPLLLVSIPVGIVLLERLERPVHDQWSELGAALSGRIPFRLREHRNALLATAVKAMFVPLMYGWTIITLERFLQLGVVPTTTNWIVWLFTLGVTVDLIIGTAGYIFASRALGTGVRSVDDSILGWIACLICYPPLQDFLHLLTEQSDGLIWSDWLSPPEPLYWLWALLIVTTWTIYWLSTVAFGLKFSNLSYRGLINVGPYRYFRHPAYLSKNLYWWLHTIPLYGALSASEMMRNVAGLALLSSIYWLRARTEERHLSRHPEYTAYSQEVTARWSEVRRIVPLPMRRLLRFR